MKTKIILFVLSLGLLCANEGLGSSKLEASLSQGGQQKQRLGLAQVYKMALAYDYSLKASYYDMKASKEKENASFADLLPRLSLDAIYQDERYKDGKKIYNNESAYEYYLILKQQVFRPDLWIAKDKAILDTKVSRLELLNSKQLLAKTVLDTYFSYLFAKQNLLLAKAYQESYKYKLEKLSKSFNKNLKKNADILEAKVRLDENTRKVSKALGELEIAKLSLANLVGKEVDISDAISYKNLEDFEKKDLKKYLNFGLNLDYKKENLKGKIAIKESTEKKLERLPKVDLEVQYGTTRYVHEDYKKYNNYEKTIAALSFSMPIFKSGAISAHVQEGIYAKQAALAREINSKNSVILKQKQAISAFKNSLFEFKLSKDAYDSALLYDKTMDESYKKGLKDLSQFLDAKARVNEAKLNAIQSANALVLAYLDLESLIGSINEKLIEELDTEIIDLNTIY